MRLKRSFVYRTVFTSRPNARQRKGGNCQKRKTKIPPQILSGQKMEQIFQMQIIENRFNVQKMTDYGSEYLQIKFIK